MSLVNVSRKTTAEKHQFQDFLINFDFGTKIDQASNKLYGFQFCPKDHFRHFLLNIHELFTNPLPILKFEASLN